MLRLPENGIIHADEERSLMLTAGHTPSEDFVAQLEHTEFGSAGLRYRRLDVARQLARFQNAVFLELRRKEELVGTYGISQAALDYSGTTTEGLYRGLLSLGPDARGQGLGQFLVNNTFAWIGAQALAQKQPVMSWGCIERQNERSLAMMRGAGATRLGTLQSLMAYRQWPREQVDVEILQTDDRDSLDAALDSTWSDCGIRDLSHSSGPYFTVKDAAGIVAGARATPAAIDMLTSGALWETVYERLLRYVPAARRRFDPHEFRYLRLSELVVRPGTERAWRKFLPTLLARHGMYFAMFVIDPRSQVATLLNRSGLFGQIAARTRQRIDVLVNGWNLPTDQIDRLARRPIAIGPLDI
jgi:GNAT superfamily N-acetyltransferase